MSTKNVFLPSKPRYEILDGLRGVAALLILVFHIFEDESTRGPAFQHLNHGYLAVEFFFLLSGFVIGYAYDDRWDKMSLGGFFKRRLVRLHPMAIMATFIGVLLFYLGADGFRLVNDAPAWKMALCFVCALFLIPLGPKMDIRGWREMYPFNSPLWTLFYEYIANILYALFIRKLPKWALRVLVALFAVLMLDRAVGLGIFGGYTYNVGSMAGGWSWDKAGIYTGFARLLFPFFCGLLIQRSGKMIKVKGAFWWCALVLAIILCMPRVGAPPTFDRVTRTMDPGGSVYNGIYEFCCVALIMPLVIMAGAGGQIQGKSLKFCKLLGDISYPLYITHYPIMYLHVQWLAKHPEAPLGQHIYVAISICVISILVAYACFKLYDLPVREWLKNHWLTPKPDKADA
ncbi:MAG: acyltransferase [Bacteroidales bacterium]|nr:acyltransferase [Bacteroidales bacterium]